MINSHNNPPLHPLEKSILEALVGRNGKSIEEKLLNKLWEQENLKMTDLTSEELNAFNSLKSRDPGYVREHKLPNETSVTILEAGKTALSAVADEDMKAEVLAERKISVGKLNVNLPPMDVQAPARYLFPGRKHPIVNLIDEVSEIFVGLGFTEIEGPITQTS